MQLANGRADNGAIPLNGGRYSIHDDVFDDINGTTYDGPSLFAQVSTGPGVPILHDVTINHVSAFAKKTSFPDRRCTLDERADVKLRVHE